jgi:tetratricopeptide (TPR) repeat protein
MEKCATRLLLLALAVAYGCGAPSPHTAVDAQAERQALAERAGAPLFDGLGNHHHPIGSEVPGVQTYFDQGMVLAFGFNHAEAIRSFRAAQRLDDDCAICFWGEALASGPNINVTSNGKAVMSREERVAAHAAVAAALDRLDHASAKERDYIAALATRYSANPEEERAAQDLAYVDAMRELAARYPEDDDVQALFAESLMNTMPWDYWLDADEPRPGTVEVLTALETVMERSPHHPLALHLYIHAVEASSTPERAEPAADRLAGLVPGSGHLVHMPAHIYWRVGRYDDASAANVLAAQVDEAYIASCNAQGFYPAAYYPHNIHFLWAASSMAGRSAVALEAARKVADNVALEQIEAFPTVELFKTIPILTLVQFGRWQEVLDQPMPAAGLDYSTAITHYARGVALANLGRPGEARGEHAALVPLRDSVKVTFLDSVDYPASHLLEIADHLLLGETARAEGDLGAAVGHYEAAVARQDELPYMEPPFWYYPSRQSLGAALLEAGRASAAEAVYRQDLAQYPRNGWALTGLALSLEAQGRDDEAAEVRKKLAVAWAKADVELTSSRL